MMDLANLSEEIVYRLVGFAEQALELNCIPLVFENNKELCQSLIDLELFSKEQREYGDVLVMKRELIEILVDNIENRLCVLE